MIKVLFWIVLLANIVIFSIIQWGSGLWNDATVAQPAFNEDKMHLLNAQQVAQLQKITAPIAEASAVSSANVQPIPNLDSSSTNATASLTCWEWGEFSDGELKLVDAALSSKIAGGNPSKRQIEHTSGYWVFIPPLPDKASTTKKIAQLKNLGVTEFFVVQETGAWHNAISLGVFKTQDAAEHYLEILRNQGVRSAKIGKRDVKLKVSILRFDGADDATTQKLTALQKEFAGSELKNVPCGLTR